MRSLVASLLAVSLVLPGGALGADRVFVGPYERDAIRPFVLGKFRDMLEATASHPAMLWYLDNWQSMGQNAPLGKLAKRAGKKGVG